jgi:hypothetical protein
MNCAVLLVQRSCSFFESLQLALISCLPLIFAVCQLYELNKVMRWKIFGGGCQVETIGVMSATVR